MLLARGVKFNHISKEEINLIIEVTKHEDMQFESFEANGKTLENSFVLYENLHEMDNNKEVRRGAAKSFYKNSKCI